MTNERAAFRQGGRDYFIGGRARLKRRFEDPPPTRG
jgi:hypothetical protein